MHIEGNLRFTASDELCVPQGLDLERRVSLENMYFKHCCANVILYTLLDGPRLLCRLLEYPTFFDGYKHPIL